VGHKALSYLHYISSLCSGGFDVCDFRHVMVRYVSGGRHGRDVHGWIGNSTCLLLRVTGRWKSTSLRSLTVHLKYIGAYSYKYIGHETANWLGWGGRRSDAVGGVGRGFVGALTLTVIGGVRIHNSNLDIPKYRISFLFFYSAFCFSFFLSQNKTQSTTVKVWDL
jgi:hypothetical protein